MEVKKEGEQKKKIGYGDLLRERNFLIQTVATIISRFGDGIDTIALSLLVYYITGSTFLVATVFAVNGLPNLLFGMVSGVFCKYISNKKVMVICDMGRGICVAIVGLLYISGNLQVWHLYVVTFLNSSFESFRLPASGTFIPSIIPKDKLDYGIALYNTSVQISQAIGLASATAIIGLFGLGVAVLIDSVSFIVCSILISFINHKEVLANSSDLTVKTYFEDLVDGFKYLKRNKVSLLVIIFATILTIAFIPINALEAPYATDVLHSGSVALAIMGIGPLIGITVTTSLAPKIKAKISGRKMFLLGGLVIVACYYAMASIGLLNNIAMYIALGITEFIAGIGMGLMNYVTGIVMIKKTEKEYLSRVTAISITLALCATPIVACIVGIASKYISIPALFVISATILMIVFITQIFNNEVRAFDEC